MKYSKVLSHSITAIISFVAGGAVSAWIIKSKLFKFDNEINVTDLLTLIVTVGLALYIGFYVETTKENKRGTKDLFISYYKEFWSYLESRLNGIQDGDSISKRNRALKQIRSRLHELNELTVARKLLKKKSVLPAELNNLARQLWTAYTDKAILDERSYENIELIQIKLSNLMNKITVEINESK